MSKWEFAKLENVCELITDGTHQTPQYVDKDKGYIFLSSKNVTSKFIDWDDVKYIPEELHKELYKHTKPQRGDILLAKNGTTGVAALVDRDKVFDIYVSLALLRPKHDIYAPYLLNVINSPYTKRQFNKSLKGVGVSNLHLKEIRNTVIPVPSIEIQKHIASTLEKTQEIIDGHKKQLEELDNLIKAVFYDMFGDPVINEKNYKVVELGEVCDVERGGSPRPINEFLTTDDDGINWIKIGDTEEDSMYITKTGQKIKPEGMKKSRYVSAGDFLLSNSMSFGRPYILKIDGCIHDGWLVLRDKENSFIKEYLYYALSNQSTYKQFKKLAVGGVVNNLNSTIVKSVRFILPPLELQNKFTQIVESIEQQKSLVKQSIAEAQTLFNSLMSKYFD